MKVSSPLGRLIGAYLWHYKLTRPGKFLIASGLVSGFIGLSSELTPTYALFFALFVIGLFMLVANTLMRPKLTVQVSFPTCCVGGHPTGALAKVHNIGKRVAWDISVSMFGLPSSLRLVGVEVRTPVLPAGETITLPIRIRALKRGLYPLPPVRAYSTFPLHVLRAGSAKCKQAPLLVLPSFQPLETFEIPLMRRYQPGGFSLTANLGESPEYIGNRDYQQGDSVRRIDSRAWARLARPAVREYQEEYYSRIALVVDTHVAGRKRAGPKGHTILEAAISLTAAIADNLARGEYIIDLFAAGPELYTFRAGQSLAHLENVLEILACLDPCPHNPFTSIAPALSEELGNIAMVVCVFLDWDETRRQLVQMAEETGCTVRAFVVRNGPVSIPILDQESSAVMVLSADAILRGEVISL